MVWPDLTLTFSGRVVFSARSCEAGIPGAEGVDPAPLATPGRAAVESGLPAATVPGVGAVLVVEPAPVAGLFFAAVESRRVVAAEASGAAPEPGDAAAALRSLAAASLVPRAAFARWT
jgi:hypothetical protein